ncbi:sulfatase-modifying factor 1 [Platysternon megacephalum]|uniref:Sulfatase-modifying factor 1 n=1 Tax=Platysternon megacephalum TaxID=55544 RepID=A0A4D9DSG6_9SAUR|nr:sulfatase-modifying factor 1 [Platysternon megacephalum]
MLKNSTKSTTFPENTTESVLVTTASTVTPPASNSTNVQPGLSATVNPLVFGLAAGIPSIVALVLGIILAVTCIRQRTRCSCNKAKQGQEVAEECKYEQTIPKLPKVSCVSMMKEPTNAYENEDQKPPRRLPAPIPRKSNWARNIKQDARPAGRKSLEVSLEAVYETCIPSPIIEKREKRMGWD